MEEEFIDNNNLRMMIGYLRQGRRDSRSYYYQPLQCFSTHYGDCFNPYTEVPKIELKCDLCGKTFEAVLSLIQGKVYQKAQEILKSYLEKGFDVKLLYYCPDCCTHCDTPKVKFGIAFNPRGYYIYRNNEDMRNRLKADYIYSSVEDNERFKYFLVLDFLTKYRSYDKIMEYESQILRHLTVSECDLKLVFDQALVDILGVDIFYDKDEVVRHYLFGSQCLYDKERLKLLERYDDNHRFTPQECQALLESMRKLKKTS